MSIPADDRLAARLARLSSAYAGRTEDDRYSQPPEAPLPPPEGEFLDLIFDGDRLVELRDSRGNRTEYGAWLETEHGRALRLPLRQVLPDPTRNQTGKAHRGASGPERTAAQLQKVGSGTKRAAVLGAFITDHRGGGDGLIDEDLQERFGIYRDTAGPRRLELVEMGYLRSSGRERRTTRKSPSTVWELTDAAIEKLHLPPRRTP